MRWVIAVGRGGRGCSLQCAVRPALKHGCRSCDTDSPEELAADVTFSAEETAASHLNQTATSDVGFLWGKVMFQENQVEASVWLVISWDQNAANVTPVIFFFRSASFF